MSAREPSPSNFGQRLAELQTHAAPAPWQASGVQKESFRVDDLLLIAYLRNHAGAILALVEAAEKGREALRTLSGVVPAWEELRLALEALNRVDLPPRVPSYVDRTGPAFDTHRQDG